MFAEYIHVSCIHSQDIISCGSKTLPCSSLEYSFNIVAKDNDTILVDGGLMKQCIYHVLKVIMVAKNIKIKGYNGFGTKHGPVITTNRRDRYIFVISSGSFQSYINRIDRISESQCGFLFYPR